MLHFAVPNQGRIGRVNGRGLEKWCRAERDLGVQSPEGVESGGQGGDTLAFIVMGI